MGRCALDIEAHSIRSFRLNINLGFKQCELHEFHRNISEATITSCKVVEVLVQEL